MAVVSKKKKRAVFKSEERQKATRKKNTGFEKAWNFWKDIQVDLSRFKFDREEANAR
jgi:hypothetical protein